MERLPKPFYYLEVAKQVASRSTCLSKQYGAVIVKDDRIISTGYNGAPRGRINCCDRGTCLRDILDVPRGMGYSETCLHKDTVIKLLNGKYKTIKELAKRKKDKSFWVYAVDPKTGKIVPAKARNARITGYAETLLKITLHDGTSFQCTPDHKIMLRDCTFAEARDLKIGDSLMPMYYKFMNADHEYICNTYTNSDRADHMKGATNWGPTHKLVYEYFNGAATPGCDIHHRNFKPHDNTPGNLEELTKGKHTTVHNNTEERKAVAFGGREGKLRGLKNKYERFKTDPEYRERISAVSRNTMTRNWKDPKWKEHLHASSSANAKRLSAKYNSDPKVILNRRRGSIASGISLLMFRMFCNNDNTKLTEDNYTEIRKKYVSHEGKGVGKIPKLASIYKYCDSFEEAIELGRYYNHRVVSIEEIAYNNYVYDLEVDDYHNFAIDLGNNSCVFVHNCAAVHAEQNAIIFADYADMVDSELYLYGWDLKRNAMVQAPNICKLCQRMIINADIRAVIIADPDNGIPNAQVGYGARTIIVQDWVDNDDSYDPLGGDYANYRV